MDTDSTPPTVRVCALVGRIGRLLLLPGPEPDTYVLPGAVVSSGEPVEHTLRKTLQEQLATTATTVSFFAAAEHGSHDQDNRRHSEITLLFDVTSTDPDCPVPLERHWWVDERELAAIKLRPKVVKDLLIRGPLLPPRSWWGWTP
jgi:hypothetical protein